MAPYLSISIGSFYPSFFATSLIAPDYSHINTRHETNKKQIGHLVIVMRALMSRWAFINSLPSATMGLFCFSKTSLEHNQEEYYGADANTLQALDLIKPTSSFREPPSKQADFYSDNPTVFGEILRGERPCRVLAETNQLLAFVDRSPRAPLHALVIPKTFIPSVLQLANNAESDALLQDMHDTATRILQEHAPHAYANNDYRLCFHIPPFNSVGHLHLHVLAPLSCMEWYHRNIKYAEDTQWSQSYANVLKRRRQKQKQQQRLLGNGSHPRQIDT